MAITIFPLKRGSVKVEKPVLIINTQVKTLRLNQQAFDLLRTFGDSSFVSYLFDEEKPNYFWIKPCGGDSKIANQKKRASNVAAYSAAPVVKRMKLSTLNLNNRYVLACSGDIKLKALKVSFNLEI